MLVGLSLVFGGEVFGDGAQGVGGFAGEFVAEGFAGFGRAGFGVVGDVEGFDQDAGEVVEIFAIFASAALLQHEELAEIAEGGGAARGDAVLAEGAEDLGEGGANFLLGGRIGGEDGEGGGDVLIVLGGRALLEFLELAVGAAEAVEAGSDGEATVAAVGVFKFTEVVGRFGAFDGHGGGSIRSVNIQ